MAEDTLKSMLAAEMDAYYKGEYIDGAGAKDRIEAFARAYAAQAVAQQAESRRAAQAQVAQLQERIARAGIEQQRAVREAVAQERERCARIVEAYKVPVGNSAAGEMACEWTMDALKEVRDAIRAGSPSPQPAPQPPSGIVTTTGFAQVIDGPKEPVAYRYWKDKFACWEYSDTPLEFPAVPAGTVMEPLYLNPPPPSAGEETKP